MEQKLAAFIIALMSTAMALSGGYYIYCVIKAMI